MKRRHGSAMLARSDFGEANGGEDVLTPPELLRTLENEFGTMFDVAPLHGTRRLTRWDGLRDAWKTDRWNYCNPPYATVRQWLEKAASEMRSERKARSVFLVPFRGNTEYWFSLVYPNACQVRLIEGRVRFGGHRGEAPLPICVLVFNPHHLPLAMHHVCESGYEERRVFRVGAHAT